MAWVQLDDSGHVIAVFGGPQPGNAAVTEVTDDDPRIMVFRNPVETGPQAALRQLRANDAAMFRMLEVLVDTLIAKGTLAPADFPPGVRAMYQARRALRVTAGQP